MAYAKPLLMALALSSSIAGVAQITEVGTLPNQALVVNSLMAGPKILHLPTPGANFNEVVLYNPDLSVYASVALPALPAGGGYHYPRYITDALFDNDPSTFEFIIPSFTAEYVYGCKVIRQDGTVLFERGMETIGVYAGGSIFDSYEPIYNTGSGTYMILFASGLNGPSTQYSLPGHLPCRDCSGLNLILAGTEEFRIGELGIAPNPATETVTVSLGALYGKATLIVYGSDGRLVERRSTQGTDKVILDVRSLAKGEYVVHLETADGQRASGKFLVQ